MRRPQVLDLRFPTTLLASAFLLLMSGHAEAANATRTENFDAGLGHFSSANGNTSGNNNFGLSNSSLAGGSADELGGTFARTAGSTNAFVADTNLGGVLSKGEDLVLSGKMYLDNISWDGAMFVGFFNTGIDSKASILGMLIEEPSGQANDGFRVSASVNDVQGQPKLPIGFQEVALDFSLTWDADSSGDGSGTLSGTVGSFILSPVTVGPGSSNYNAFGVGAGGVSSSNPAVQMTAFFDDLTYSVIPEPATATIALLALSMLWSRRQRA